MKRHNIFISYYHDDDQWYKNKLAELNKNDSIFIDGSVDTNDIDDNGKSFPRICQIIRDEYLKDTTVTILLIGANTDKRKYVDREISSSLIDGKINKRSGLLGILLPEHPCYYKGNYMNKNNTQKRFVDNYKRGYAILITWGEIRNNPELLKAKIHEAFLNKNKINPDNSEILRQKNTEK